MKLKSLKLKEQDILQSLFFSFLKVMQRQFLRSGRVLASFKLDIATVMQQPGITRKASIIKNEHIEQYSTPVFFLRMSILSQVGCFD